MKSKKIGILAVALLLTAIGMEVAAKSASKGQLSGVVNINEASVAQLTMLPGVGQKRGQEIHEYAKAHPFKNVEELKAIKGIGDKGLDKLRPFIAVSGLTTAKWVKSEVRAQNDSVKPTLNP